MINYDFFRFELSFPGILTSCRYMTIEEQVQSTKLPTLKRKLASFLADAADAGQDVVSIALAPQQE